MTSDYDYGAQASYTLQLFCYFFVIMFVLNVTDMIKTLELCLLLVIWHFQISVPKIGEPVPTTACINSWMVEQVEINCFVFRSSKPTAHNSTPSKLALYATHFPTAKYVNLKTPLEIACGPLH